MAARSPDRSSYFPAIEKKHGEPMSYWFGVMAEIQDQKYAEQVAYLRDNHGFSREHANALVLYSRGSTTSRRFDSLDEYLAGHDAVKQETVREIFRIAQAQYPDLELVIAWNTPMLKLANSYLFGVSVLKGHLLLAPYDSTILDAFRPRLAEYEVKKKSFRVPVDWDIDHDLVRDLLAACVAESTD